MQLVQAQLFPVKLPSTMCSLFGLLLLSCCCSHGKNNNVRNLFLISLSNINITRSMCVPLCLDNLRSVRVCIVLVLFVL